MASWLFKEEPTHYNFAALERDGATTWDGVKNALAQKHLRQIKKGDAILYYHTGKERAVVGIAKAVDDAYPDPQIDDGKTYVVDIEVVRPLEHPVTLASLKARKGLEDFDLVRLPRLSVMPVTKGQWKTIESMAESGAN